MEDWQYDFEWLKIRHFLKDKFSKEEIPDLNAVLFLIGIQTLGRWKKEFTKEEKQDLMHIAICEITQVDGCYVFKGRDHDGWPHYEALKPIDKKGVKEQEKYLIVKVIEYFEREKYFEDEEQYN